MANASVKLEKRRDKDGNLIVKNVPIVIDFTFDSKRMWVYTGERIDASKWDEKAGKVKSSAIGALEINNLTKTNCEKLLRIYREAKIMGIDPSIGYIRGKFTEDQNYNTKSVFGYYDDFLAGQKLKSAKGTIVKLSTNITHLKNFCRKNKITLEFELIDEWFLNRYVEYFIKELNHTNGTIAKNIKILKWFLNWAVKNGYNKNLAYKSYSVNDPEIEIIVLSEAELMQVYYADLETESLCQVRDIFCFCCFTALRYSDIKNLRKVNVMDNYLEITSIKTKSKFTVPLIEYSKEIIEKYKNYDDEYVLPVISNQKMNDYLKEVGKAAELNRIITKVRYRGSERIETSKPLYEYFSTHMARRTFISYMFRKGIDSELIRSISNHRSLSSFVRYNNIENEHKLEATTAAFKFQNNVANVM